MTLKMSLRLKTCTHPVTPKRMSCEDINPLNDQKAHVFLLRWFPKHFVVYRKNIYFWIWASKAMTVFSVCVTGQFI